MRVYDTEHLSNIWIIYCKWNKNINPFITCIYPFRGVIVLVDSVHFPREVSNLAHLLIDLLSEPRVHKRHVPILIACNKQGQ